MKSIYTTYKERLVEISGKNRSVFSRKGNTKFSYDIGALFHGNNELFEQFIKSFWNRKQVSYPLINAEMVKKLYIDSGLDKEITNSDHYLELKEKDEEAAKKYLITNRKKAIKKLVESQVNTFSKLKKEIVDLAKETGRYELYIGYPFVVGTLKEEIQFKAPLLLFPVKINIVDDSNVTLEPILDMPVTLNKALLFSYANERKLNIDEMNTEFSGNLTTQFKNVNDVLKYLSSNHINFKLDKSSLISPFTSSGIPGKNDDLRVVNHCTIGRYPLANSIYNDYNELEKRKVSTNKVIDELIYAKSSTNTKKINKVDSLYPIYNLDYSQEKALEAINNDGNVVIYGPPGTGKSQTIVNVISDALVRKKRVLVVSQKKAALDVVFNRLGSLKNKAMFISDPEKEREFFYKRALEAHKNMKVVDTSNELLQHKTLEKNITQRYKEIEDIFNVLYEPTPFGASLELMYEQSSQITKNSKDYLTYQALINRLDLLSIKYQDLEKSMENIKRNDRNNLYYKYNSMKEKNSVIDHLDNDLDIYTVESVIKRIEKILADKTLGFDTSKYPYSAYLIAYCVSSNNMNKPDFKSLINLIAKDNKKGVISKKELYESFTQAHKEIMENIKSFEFLKGIMSDKGYKMVVGAVLNGNTNMFKNLKSALNNYIKLRDIKVELSKLSETDKLILDFAYTNSESLLKYNQVVDNFMPIRFYIEITNLEQERKEDLAKIMNFNSIRDDILSMKETQNVLSNKIALSTFNKDYLNKFNSNSKTNKDFLYQLNKQQNYWPIRRFMKEYVDYMLDLYPCWLLSPENVSTIMPLIKDMFDIVLVDEASQVFIENTLPLMCRAKNIVVAGDSKQLRPTSVFMKRYMGSDIDENVDPTTEAALEVESLLDLAISRLTSVYLNCHYRSLEELIIFSNNYFYDGKLDVVPNLVSNKKNSAITRLKVNGKWEDRRNDIEAKKVVEILKDTLNNRKNNQSIGIITFNSEQSYAIEEAIRKECKNDPKFAEQILLEQNRFENNVDTSLFVKNLENVQGDERNVIILSVGYAYNDKGKVVTNFGSLSSEGGENRLNVAITRAKERIFVVTSIEPEDLKVENTKNEGPKIFKKYLNYVKAVSSGNKKEARVWLNSKKESLDEETTSKDIIANEIRDELRKLGYQVDVKVGNAKNKVDLAVYDSQLGRYLLGIDCINKEYKNIQELIENQIYHLSFLQSRGWNIYRVWTRDWWLNKNKVINSIVKEIEKTKKELEKEKQMNKKKK